MLSLKLPFVVEELQLFLLFGNSHDARDTGLQIINDLGLGKNWVVGEDLIEKKLVDRLGFL